MIIDLENILTIGTSIVTVGTSIVTVASAITATTNTPKEDNVLRWIYRIIEFFALVNEKVKQK